MSTLTEVPYLPRTAEERQVYERFYHEHKEAHVPQSCDQDRVSDDVGDILSVHAPHLWTARDLCCYWIVGNNQRWLAPDVLAGDPPGPEPGMRSYRQWEHGRLRLVLEVVSEESRTRDRGPKLERYAVALRPEEYLYFDPDFTELRLWRWDGTAYQEALPDARGRLWSEAARLWFMPEGRLLRVENAGGERLRTYREEAAHSREETLRAEAERREREAAEQRTEAERREREAAEARAEVAEARAEAEQREREAAEHRAQELAVRLAALEAELARTSGPGEAGPGPTH